MQVDAWSEACHSSVCVNKVRNVWTLKSDGGARWAVDGKAWQIFRWKILNPDFCTTALLEEQSYTLRTGSTAMLGKRKRSALNNAMASSASQADLQEIFKRHFEAQFQPLPDQQPLVASKQPTEADLVSDEENSDWDGISTDGEALSIEVVEYTAPTKAERAELPKEELKGFMVKSRH